MAAGDLRGELSDDHAALDDGRNRRHCETDGGDAAGRARVGLVTDQSVVRVSLMKVVLHRGALQSGEFFVRRQAVQVLGCRLVAYRFFQLSHRLCSAQLDPNCMGFFRRPPTESHHPV